MACPGFLERTFGTDKRGKRVVFAAFGSSDMAAKAMIQLAQHNLLAELSMKPLTLGRNQEGYCSLKMAAANSSTPSFTWVTRGESEEDKTSFEIPAKPNDYERRANELLAGSGLAVDLHGSHHHTLFVCVPGMSSDDIKSLMASKPGFKEFTPTLSLEKEEAAWVQFEDKAAAASVIEDFVKLHQGWLVFAKRIRAKPVQQPGQRTLFLALGRAVLQPELEELFRTKVEGFVAANFTIDKRGQKVCFAGFETDENAMAALQFFSEYKSMSGMFSTTPLDPKRARRRFADLEVGTGYGGTWALACDESANEPVPMWSGHAYCAV